MDNFGGKELLATSGVGTVVGHKSLTSFSGAFRGGVYSENSPDNFQYQPTPHPLTTSRKYFKFLEEIKTLGARNLCIMDLVFKNHACGFPWSSLNGNVNVIVRENEEIVAGQKCEEDGGLGGRGR